MTRVAAAFAILATIFSGSLYLGLLLGRPPRHCHYMVAVASRPGVYSCSEYPRPLKTLRTSR